MNRFRPTGRLALATLLMALLAAPNFAAADDDGGLEQPNLTALGNRLVQWVRQHNTFGPDHAIVADVQKTVETGLAKSNHLRLAMGSGLTDTGKPLMLYIWDNRLYLLPLTAAQAEKLEIKRMTLTTYDNSVKLRTRRAANPGVQLEGLNFSSQRTVPNRGTVTGQIVCRNVTLEPGAYALRMSFNLGRSVRSVYHHLGSAPEDGQAISFSFPSISSDSDKEPFTGPLPVFVDLCRLGGSKDDQPDVIHSNTLALVVNVVTGQEVAKKTEPAPQAQPGQLRVRLPANATLTVNGNPTRQTGAERSFETPPLEPGKPSVYVLRATWVEQGESVSQEKQVSVEAGKVAEVTFRADVAAARTPARTAPEPSVQPAPNDRAALLRQAMAWLEENHKDNAEWTEKARNAFTKSIDEGEDFHCTFGPGIMTSGKPYQVHVFAGKFYAIPLTIPQVKHLLDGPNGITFHGGKRGYQIEPTFRAVVRQPRIDNAENLDARKNITGRVAFQVRDKAPDKLAVRLSYRAGGSSSMLLHHLNNGLPQERGSVSFSFRPLDDGKEEKKITGPVVVFIDLCVISEEPDPEFGGAKIPKIKVISNSVPVLVDVASAANN
jgi:uncharacterized protein (TIGR03000 family)